MLAVIYSILVFHKGSGVNLYSHHFKEFAGDDSLAAGMVMAITGFLEELKWGKLKSFITHEKRVIIVPTNEIFTALVIDLDDLEHHHNPDLEDNDIHFPITVITKEQKQNDLCDLRIGGPDEGKEYEYSVNLKFTIRRVASGVTDEISVNLPVTVSN